MARGRTKVRSRRQRGDANAEDAQNGKKQKPVLPNGQQGAIRHGVCAPAATAAST